MFDGSVTDCATQCFAMSLVSVSQCRLSSDGVTLCDAATATPGGMALGCMLPEWQRDNRAAAPKEYFELWNEARNLAVDPPRGSILRWLYPAFIFLDTSYLAWETLATKSLPLSVMTQAVALAALYAAERVSAARKP